MCFVRAGGGDEPGGGGDGRDDPRGGAQAVEVGDDAGEERADREAAVASQPMDADGVARQAG
ncbi:hypothetical protein [Lentzea sp. NPDC051838]|uniref:hypothetical protein n=1 Tax=Lentzea sp. NPDC051838 TaxID=3154849 RepID=UPI003446236B